MPSRAARSVLAGTLLVLAGWLPAGAQSTAARADTTAGVDLSDPTDMVVGARDQTHVLSRPWYENLDVSGFGAFGYVDSGRDGTRPHGGFQIKETTVQVEMDIWSSSSFYLELQTNRLGDDELKFVRTGEVYAHFRELVRTRNAYVSAKVGRIDIPFGEEYLWQDAPDNPLISQSASYPYGWDEGVLLYGTISRLNWIASVTDGTDARSVEDDPSKTINLKFYGDLGRMLTVSASVMRTGSVGKSAIEFGGSHFQPVGASHASSVGASGADLIEAKLFETTGKTYWGRAGTGGYVAATVGGARQEDVDPSFDRELRWLTLEGLVDVGPGYYLVARYSEIGTYDDEKGFHFDGKPTAGANGAFGYDVRRFRRTSIGVGYDPNPRVRLKLEVGRDRFYVIDAAPALPDADDRRLFGLELAIRY